MGEAVRDILDGLGLKPYVVQRQLLTQFGSDVWENIDQFDTLEEAWSRLSGLRADRKVRYRIAQAMPYIKYEQVRGMGWAR